MQLMDFCAINLTNSLNNARNPGLSYLPLHHQLPCTTVDEWRVPIDLPLAIYRFQYQVLDELYLPKHPGTLWHSVFGNALHQLVCVTKDTECVTCMFLHQCDYTHIFLGIRPPDSEIMRKYTTIPTPHILRPPLTKVTHLPAGERLEVDVILPGIINSKLPTLIRALYSAGISGLGKYRSRAQLQQVTQLTSTGVSKALLIDGRLVAAAPPAPIDVPLPPNTARIHLLTPYKPSGKADHGQRIEIGLYLMAIIRRIDLMQYFYTGHKLETDFQHLKALTASIPVLEQSLQRQAYPRYSAARQQAKDAGGFTGQFTLDMHGHEALWPFLYMGQWLNVGKNASMGFGRYELASANQDTMGA